MKIIQYKDKYNDQINKFIFSILIEELKYECHREKILKEDNKKYQENNGAFWIAIDNDHNIIGTICIDNIENGVGKLKKLYVDTNYRGNGLAHKLYDKLLNFAKKNGINRIELSTYNKLEAAVKFYIKKGFKQTNKEIEEDDAIHFVLEKV